MQTKVNPADRIHHFSSRSAAIDASTDRPTFEQVKVQSKANLPDSSLFITYSTTPPGQHANEFVNRRAKPISLPKPGLRAVCFGNRENG
jgi:hypothetical protein